MITKSDSRLIAMACIMAVVFFAIDVSIELGVADGILYIPLVLIALWISDKRYIFCSTLAATALTILGFYFSPPGGEPWKVLVNRGLILAATWTTAILISRHRALDQSLEEARNLLESRVRERTQDLTLSNRQLEGSREQLRNLNNRLNTVREEERAGIAREVHDELGQVLSTLKVEVALIENKLGPEQEPLREKTRFMMELIDKTILTVQKIATELRPEIIDIFGLSGAVEYMAKDFRKRTGIACEIHIRPENLSLDKARSISIYRIVQEALTNVIRHANAEKVAISMVLENDSITIRVIDDGVGTPEDRVFAPESLGLLGMRERVLAWKGKIDLRSAPLQGTEWIIKIPAVSLETPAR